MTLKNFFQNYLKFKHGRGVPADMEEAGRYCKLAADKGHTRAMFNYGKMLSEGRGVPVNETEACRYYKMAADKGHRKAMNKYTHILSQSGGY